MNTMFLHILLCGIIILLGTLVGSESRAYCCKNVKIYQAFLTSLCERLFFDNYIKCKEYE